MTNTTAVRQSNQVFPQTMPPDVEESAKKARLKEKILGKPQKSARLEAAIELAFMKVQNALEHVNNLEDEEDGPFAGGDLVDMNALDVMVLVTNTFERIQATRYTDELDFTTDMYRLCGAISCVAHSITDKDSRYYRMLEHLRESISHMTEMVELAWPSEKKAGVSA